MPIDGSGNITRTYDFTDDATNGVKISSARVDAEIDNLIDGVQASFFASGVKPMTGNLAMGGFSISGIGAGSAATPALRHSADATTGVFFSAGTVGLSAGGTARVTITAATTAVANNATVAGTLAVTGASTLTGNTAVGGTLGVTGATTLAATTIAGAVGITGAVTVTGNTALTGALTVSTTLGVTGNATFGGTLGVTGVATFTASPVVPTLAPGDNTTKAASTAFVTAAVAAISTGAWTQIGATVTPGAVSSIDLSSIPATYSDLLVVFDGISHSAGTNQGLAARFSSDGATFSSPGSFSSPASFAAAATLNGSLFIPGYRLLSGQATLAVANLGAAPADSGDIGVVGAWELAAAMSAIRIWFGGTANFDAGTIKLYGR